MYWDMLKASPGPQEPICPDPYRIPNQPHDPPPSRSSLGEVTALPQPSLQALPDSSSRFKDSFSSSRAAGSRRASGFKQLDEDGSGGELPDPIPIDETYVRKALGALQREEDSGWDYHFTDIDYAHVTCRGTRPILSGFTGYLQGGRATLILGPTKSGKSSFLKLMAGRLTQGFRLRRSGTVQYGPYRGEDIIVPRLVGYVPQTDEHYPCLTVDEIMGFAAACLRSEASKQRLREAARRKILKRQPLDPGDADPETLSRNSHVKLMELLGLADPEVRHTISGDAEHRGLSGGQRRRLTIGEVLVGMYGGIMADEVTNGLDSHVAFGVVQLLVLMAHELSCTVAVALLQPIPATFRLFDDVMVLMGGRIAYLGPREDAVPYFQGLGFQKGPGQDDADFLLHIAAEASEPPERTAPHAGHEAAAARTRRASGLPEVAPGSAGADPVAATSPIATGRESLDAAAPRPPPWPTTPSDFSEAYRASQVCRDREARAAGAPRSPDAFPTAPSTRGADGQAASVLEVRSQRTYRQRYAVSTLRLVSLCHQWYWRLVWRTPAMLKARLLANSALALILGSLYWNADDDAKLACVYYSILFVCCNNFLGNVTTDERPILYRHLQAFQYSPAAHTLARVGASAAVSVLDAVVFGTIVYWMAGFTASFGRFAFALLNLVLACIYGDLLWQLTALATPNGSARNLVGALIVIALQTMTGYTIPEAEIPPYFIWAYWVQPASHVYVSMAQSEFDSEQGKAFLRSRGVSDAAWRSWLGPVACGLAALLTAGGILGFLTHKRFQTPVPAKGPRQPPPPAPDGEAQAIPFVPMTLAWRGVCYRVDLRGKGHKRGNLGRELLHDVSGHACPGQMLALMGESGSGKTTLMDVLFGRKTGGAITGEVLANGAPVQRRALRRAAAYALQEDIHVPTATVSEAVAFAAALRLPRATPRAARGAHVRYVLDLLGLGAAAGARVWGLNGAELKQLTVAVELAASPALLFLDEPTTGLDSEGALAVMRAVRKVSATGRAVVCTIHRPNRELFLLFDTLLLLLPGGRRVYFGPVGDAGQPLADHFQSWPGVAPLARADNPATWVLEVLAQHKEVDWPGRFEGSPAAVRAEAAQHAACQPGAQPEPGGKRPARVHTQAALLVDRALRMYLRFPAYVPTLLGAHALYGVVFGLLFLGTTPDSVSGIISLLSPMLLSVNILGIGCHHGVADLVQLVRQAYYREKSSCMYHASVSALSLVLCNVPGLGVCALVYQLISYFMIGYHVTAAAFFHSVALFAWWLVLCHTTAWVLGMWLPSPSLARNVANFLPAIQASFCGFFVPRSDIPSYWIWLHYVNPMTYAFFLGSINLLECEGPGCTVMTDTTVTTWQFAQQYYGFSSAQRLPYWLILLGYEMLCLVLLWVGLRFIQHGTI